ncbi:MAG: hypothetical protein IKX71_07465 [Bacteroidales bacterium]|nr:hypothetical protein [Bacteroidales bacterium]
MRKLICLVLTITIGIAAFAQQEHLTFKNIPISGPSSSFIEKMKQAGFEVVSELENGLVMEGTFVGLSDCKILVGITPKTKTVWKVIAQLPSKSSWYSVKNQYFEFKEKYTDKYGKPNDEFEFFSKPYYEGDGYELQAVKNDKGYYTTYWKSDLGIIVVSIAATSSSEGWVQLGYEDANGVEIRRQEESTIIDDDI